MRNVLSDCTRRHGSLRPSLHATITHHRLRLPLALLIKEHLLLAAPPDAQGPVVAAGDEVRAVGRRCQCPQLALVPLQGVDVLKPVAVPVLQERGEVHERVNAQRRS